MKYATDRPYADPEAAARKLVEIANSVEAVQDGRIHIEKINGPFLYEFKASPQEYGAGLKLAIDRGWLWLPGTKPPQPYSYKGNPGDYDEKNCRAAGRADLSCFRRSHDRQCERLDASGRLALPHASGCQWSRAG
jgi:hypothetical protein